jgi:hypothetical protein
VGASAILCCASLTLASARSARAVQSFSARTSSSISAFAAAISDLLNDPQEREQLGLLARARAHHYSPERMARGMAEIYARVAAPAEAQAQMAGAA